MHVDHSTTPAPTPAATPSPSRRALVASAVWAVPTVTIAAAAPAHATSSNLRLVALTPSADFTENLGADRSVTVNLLRGDVPEAGRNVTFSLDNTSWLTLSSAGGVTDVAGLATTRLLAVAGATPSDGASVVLTATQGTLSVTWTITHRPVSSLPHHAARAINVAALRAGRAHSWGGTSYWQLGHTSSTPQLPHAFDRGAMPAEVTVAQMSVGTLQTVVLGSDGHVYSCGDNRHGSLGNGTRTGSRTLVRALRTTMPESSRIIAVSSGHGSTLALSESGVVYTWGDNYYSQLGDGTETTNPIPKPISDGAIPDGVGVAQIAAGDTHSLALGTDGLLYAWGFNNGSHALGQPAYVRAAATPVTVQRGDIPEGATIAAMTAGYMHNGVLDSNGVAYTWGSNTYGQLGTGVADASSRPTPVDQSQMPDGVTFTDLDVGTWSSIALGSDGIIYCWGWDTSTPFATMVSHEFPVAVPLPLPAGERVVKIAMADDTSLALTNRGVLYAWGDNKHGCFGNGTGTGTSGVPVRVTPLP